MSICRFFLNIMEEIKATKEFDFQIFHINPFSHFQPNYYLITNYNSDYLLPHLA